DRNLGGTASRPLVPSRGASAYPMGERVPPMSDNGNSASPAGLAVLRHSAAHVLAKAIQQLYPGSKLGIGPVIDNGFYYDIDIPAKLSEDDLPRIEAQMHKIAGAHEPFRREEWSKQQALEHYSATDDNPYKREII